MGDSGWRESSIGCRLRRLLYVFSEIGRAEFSKKMYSLNTNGQHSDAKGLLDQVADETDLALEGLLRKCVRNSMHLHVARQSSTRSKCATQEARFRKKSEALA
jgi:hypothetical protein